MYQTLLKIKKLVLSVKESFIPINCLPGRCIANDTILGLNLEVACFLADMYANTVLLCNHFATGSMLRQNDIYDQLHVLRVDIHLTVS